MDSLCIDYIIMCRSFTEESLLFGSSCHAYLKEIFQLHNINNLDRKLTEFDVQDELYQTCVRNVM